MTHIIVSHVIGPESIWLDSFTADALTKPSLLQSLNHKQCCQIKGLVLKAIQPFPFDDHFMSGFLSLKPMENLIILLR